MAVVISERLLEGRDHRLDGEPDERLVELAQAGHDAAFAAIVRRYEPELKAQAHRLTSDGRAEDAVQQALLNAFAALRRGCEVRHLRGWLHHILRNEVTRARMPLEAPLDPAVMHGETLEDTVQLRATAHATLAHLSALPERQRDALLGTAVLGFPRAHVARNMGLSEGAVRQLVHRARVRLRQAATALLPFPLVRLFGAARSGLDVAPEAALSTGTAASGGLVIKVGALLASGVVATGIAVTHAFPARHHPAPAIHRGRDHAQRARPAAHHAPPASAPVVVPSGAAPLTHTVRLRAQHVPATAGTTGHSSQGPARLSGTVSGGQGGSSTQPGPGAPPARHGGSAGVRSGTSGRDGGGDTGARSGSGSTDGKSGSGSGGSGSGSASGSSGDSGSSGSGSHDGASTSDGSSQPSGGDGGSMSSTGDTTATAPSSGSSSPTTTATSGQTSGSGGGTDGGGTGSGGSDGGSSSGPTTQFSGGSRDVSGSSDSSSS